jgi:hypothetical protein
LRLIRPGTQPRRAGPYEISRGNARCFPAVPPAHTLLRPGAPSTSFAPIVQARHHLDLADRFAFIGYGPAVRLKPFRPHLAVGALSCAVRSQRAQHAPTARARQAAGAHPGGFPARRPSPAPIEPHLHPVLDLRSFCARRGITPAFGYGPRLGSVRLDFHQLATRPARRALRPAPTAARPPSPLPGFAGYRRASLPATHSGGAETALPSSQDDHPHVQRPIRRRVPQRPLLAPRRLPWPSPSPDRLGSLSSRPQAVA